ncbi:MAG: tripartite tricarboxylate transporter family receptor [Hyphomicrobiales bacterium]|nr:tripartite tricarboxylate transporter family receptor [Hyphomicrobiales bacterium]
MSRGMGIRAFHALSLGLYLSGATPVLAQDFYAGRTITLSTHTGPGGGYDTLIRLISRHLGKHIPGSPSIIVTNQPGAGGLTAFNYAARIAPQDGTFLTLVGQGLLIFEPTGQAGLQASLGDMNWIGNSSQSPNVTAVWHTSPVKTVDDAKRVEATMGSTGAGAPDAQMPRVYNALLGTRFKVVTGYTGGAQINLAMERGELDGRGTNTWPSYKSTFADAVRERKLVPLVQIGLKKDPDLPDVPLLTDLVAGDAQREPVARFLSLTTAISRPLAAPPRVPAERVAVLRRAFDATMRDPAFLAEAARMQVDIDPMTGEEVETAIRQVLSTPADVIARTQTALGTSGP